MEPEGELHNAMTVVLVGYANATLTGSIGKLG